MSAYLDFALQSRSGIERHHFLRELFVWSQRLSAALFIPVVERALRYGISDLESSSASRASRSAKAARFRCRAPKWMRASKSARPTSKDD